MAFSFIEPWMFMACSLYYLPGAITGLVISRGFRTLFSWEEIQTRWFGRFWSWAGPVVRQTGEATVIPLLEGRVADGKITEHAVNPGVWGVVVEVGAGSGMWVELFRNDYHSKVSDKTDDTAGATVGAASAIDESAYDLVSRNKASAAGVGGEPSRLGRGPITKVYGIEPNPQSHEALMQRVKDAGLEGIYEVVPVGIEHVGSGHWKWNKKIEPESVDCIISILCLCSIPDPEDNIRTLYKYLKPGGRWYAFEHVCCSGSVSVGIKWYQREYHCTPCSPSQPHAPLPMNMYIHF